MRRPHIWRIIWAIVVRFFLDGFTKWWSYCCDLTMFPCRSIEPEGSIRWYVYARNNALKEMLGEQLCRRQNIYFYSGRSLFIKFLFLHCFGNAHWFWDGCCIVNFADAIFWGEEWLTQLQKFILVVFTAASCDRICCHCIFLAKNQCLVRINGLQCKYDVLRSKRVSVNTAKFS